VVEPLGDSMDVYCSTPKHPHVVARIAANSELKSGSIAALRINAREAHFFEPGEFGRNLVL